MSSNEKFEREFAAFLAEDDSRLAALYRKLPQTEPDPRLDAAVRAMAHRALNPELVATPQANSSHRSRARWLPALGAAAGIVFAAGIAFRLGPSWHGDRGETGAAASDVITVRSIDAPPPPAPPLSPAPPQAETATPAGAASNTVTAKVQAQAPAEVPKSALEAQARAKATRLDESADNRPAAAGGSSKSEKAAAPGTQPQAFPTPVQARKGAPEIDSVERKQIMATGAWQNLHDRDVAKPGAGVTSGASAAADKQLAAPAKSAEAQRQEDLRAPMPAQAPAAASPRAAEAAATPPVRASAAIPPEQSAPPPPAGAPAPATTAPALKTDAQQPNNATPGESATSTSSGQAAQKKERGKLRSSDPNSRLYPEHWLENIRTMLREDNRDDAVRSLAEFRRMYPDYHLPDDLRDLK